MLNRLFVTKILTLTSVGVFAFAVNVKTNAQCGVYSKRAASEVFPFPNIHLDKAEDMTGDGIPDIIASGEGPGGIGRSRIFIIPNHGDGTLGSPMIINAAQGQPFHCSYYIGHVNNDSLKDVIVYINGNPSTIKAYMNNGNGTFTEQPAVSAGIGEPNLDFFDLNGDGFGDYFSVFNGLHYRLGNGDGTFGPVITIIPDRGAHRGDFNNDGKTDFINEVNLYLNQGDDTFAISPVASMFPAGFFINSVVDFNGDGMSDVLSHDFFSGQAQFAVLIRTASGFNRTNYVISNDATWRGFSTAGNLGGSSSLDVVYSSRGSNRKAVFINDGTGNFTRQDYDGKFGDPAANQLMADFDADGKLDIVQAASKIENVFPVFSDISSFTFLETVCERPGQPQIVDFDRSGTTDFSYWDPASGDWAYSSSGAFTIMQTETVNWGLGSLGDIPVPGDFDGDGITDRAVYRNSTGVWYVRRSSDLAWFVIPFGLTGDKPVPADYDGDGLSDIAVWRPSDGVWHVWHMGTQLYSAGHFGMNGDKPTPADFDGDGRTDLAVFRPSTGVWYYLKSSDGNFVASAWGTDGDQPIPADYDGDGRADLAVYRVAERSAWIRRSYDFGTGVFAWGTTGDIVQIGDFDGDFASDIAVFRPSTAAWWSSTFPFSYQKIFGESTSIPTSSILRIE